MDDKNKNVVEQYAQRNKYRGIWQKIVRTLACIVVFCTTYALILPVITMEQNYFCGLEPHTHTEACYGYDVRTEEMCSTDTLGVHTHSGGCYDENAVAICGFSHRLIHTHDDLCYDTEGNLWCVLEPVEGHTHTEACYTTEQSLICQLPEQTAHSHEALCYDAEGNLTCQQAEDVAEHIHTETCYTTEQSLTCQMEEMIVHVHEDLCRDAEGNLICGMIQQMAHQHTEACVPVLEQTIICGMEEHTHINACSIDPNAEATTEPPTELLTEMPTEPPTEMPTELSMEVAPQPPMMMNAVAPVADDGDPSTVLTYTLKNVDHTALEVGKAYILCTDTGSGTYAILDGTNMAVGNNYPRSKTIVPYGSALTPGGTWTIPATWLSMNLNQVTWQLEKNRNNNRLMAMGFDDPGYNGGEYLCINGHTIQTWNSTGNINLTFQDFEGVGCRIYSNGNYLCYNRSNGTWYGNGDQNNAAVIYFAEVIKTEQVRQTSNGIVNTDPNYPTPVKTGYSSVETLVFYNFDTSNDTLSALPGCVFEITGTTSNGNPYRRIIEDYTGTELKLPADIPTGTYTITEISAPEGYIRDVNPTRHFSIVYNHTLNQKVFGENTIGVFLNHKTGDLKTDKNAQVTDYSNRTYEIIINAMSSIQLYEMEPIDVLFVVDQSNSMLFPSGLVPTGKTVKLNRNGGENNRTNLNNLGLDTSQLYYIIADPHGTSTVYALWYWKDQRTWMYQDASFYAKAWFGNTEGMQQDNNEIAVFPSNAAFQGSLSNNRKANGGGITHSFGNGSMGKYFTAEGTDEIEFAIYTAFDGYNRLHYLEESLSQAIYMLSDADDDNTVTLTQFTKVLDETHCTGDATKLTQTNANQMVEDINGIKTTGGTRQDLALQHIWDHHLNPAVNNHYQKDKDHTFTVLITDGAPVQSDDVPVGNPYSNSTASNTIYDRIRRYANLVKQESTLITIGLGMEAVDGGAHVLEQIASEPHSMYANALSKPDELSELLCDLLLTTIKPSGTRASTGTIVDVISDSFYPVAWVPLGRGHSTGRKVLYSDETRDWILLEEYDWIDLSGQYVTWGGVGRLQKVTANDLNDPLFAEGGAKLGDYYIRWSDRDLKNPSWEGHVFVKAKEDFIGGNAIDTNKTAAVAVTHDGSQTVDAVLTLPVPTVNVRLLDMNRMETEVTVFLGDTINAVGNSPLDSLKLFYNNTKFEKLVSGLEEALNHTSLTEIPNSLKTDSFYLAYALGQDLTTEQWGDLTDGKTVTVPYTYDDASSHGPVGYFTFQLKKEGSDTYDAHTATVAGQQVETYYLYVTYTAYELGEEGRPTGNVHNASNGPGTEVGGPEAGDTLPEGLGQIEHENIHIVNVIDGTIEVTKEIASELISTENKTYAFTLTHEDGTVIPLAVTVEAGQTTGTATATGLKRGTYTLEEAHDDLYHVESVVIQPGTNCDSVESTPTAVFYIGYDPSGANVIGKDGNALYTSYTGSPNGVFGAARVRNVKTIYYGEIPVEKIWASGSRIGNGVYVVLYKDDGPVLADGQARILRLDAGNSWTGTFRVALEAKDQNVADLNYIVREAKAVADTLPEEQPERWQGAILENHPSTILYYNGLAEEGDSIEMEKANYTVSYHRDDTTGKLTVTNHPSYVLPQTGGMGTHLYTISGLVLLALVTLIYGYSRRRKTGRGASA